MSSLSSSLRARMLEPHRTKASLAGSEGWMSRPPISSQRIAPLTSVPWKAVSNSNATERIIAG